MSNNTALKCPFPYFGGKSRVAQLVWSRLGDVDNYIEGFCGSAAMLLLRPHAPKIETVNDMDCYVANFWRATQHAPDTVAEAADWPVNEADLHARHRWLVLSEPAAEFRKRMRTDPEYYDARIAGWWCWGLCCWIGGGWCKTDQLDRHQNSTPDMSVKRGVHRTPQEQTEAEIRRNEGSTPALAGSGGKGQGVTRDGERPEEWNQIPVLTDNGPGRGVNKAANLPPGVHNRRPHIDGGEGQYGHGVHAKGKIPEQLPLIGGGDGRCNGMGVHGDAGNRPQLADAFSRGRGVHGHDDAGTCEQRRRWLLDWFGRLRDRLRTVRVCCGDWLRVCDSPSVTTRLGVTGVFFDPPYSAAAGRDNNLYATESLDVAHKVRDYCLERGSDPKMRITLCGYEGEGHEILEKAGWDVVLWKASGGYGNRTKKGKSNAGKERLWFSPHCQAPKQADLFARLETNDAD